MSSNPPIAITMGDPAGIGPGIAVKVAAARDLPACPIIICDHDSLARAAKIANVDVDVIEIKSLAAFDAESDDILLVRKDLAGHLVRDGRCVALGVVTPGFLREDLVSCQSCTHLGLLQSHAGVAHIEQEHPHGHEQENHKQ